jgi:GNAT superfamily N-acetyltransferase
VRFNQQLARETEGRALDPALLREGVTAVLSDSSKGLYFLAESGGVVVGQLMITFEWSDWRNGNFWWIQSVYVEQSFRRKGVFTSLHSYLRQVAAGQKNVCGLRLYVEKENESAKRAYERIGLHGSHYEMWEIDFVLTP